VFVLDRETGAPIKQVEELLVPQAGHAPGERLSPTQPFPPACHPFVDPSCANRTCGA
jgi:glucose dehydrogenase